MRKYIPLDCLPCPSVIARSELINLVSILLIDYLEFADEVGSTTEARPYSWR